MSELEIHPEELVFWMNEMTNNALLNPVFQSISNHQPGKPGDIRKYVIARCVAPGRTDEFMRRPVGGCQRR
jgi:hypothetical protein